jgi:Bifunctional DNA primase/polymerase, N-terminal
VTSGPDRRDPMLAAALQYARANWPVFPCMPGEKVPATRHGFLDATTDRDKIAWWCRRDPERNVAIATGLPGPDVLDVDVRADGNGFGALGRLRSEGLLDGAGAYVRTPSGGLHTYFTGSEQGNGRLPAHHLDFRSLGGYVVAPPSLVYGKRYELIRHREGWLESRPGGLDWVAVTRLLDPQPERAFLSAAGARSADPSRLAGWVARLAEGNRNDGLFWAASRVLESGVTDLGELAEAARKTGLEEHEIARTLASAQRRADRSLIAEPPGADRPEPASRPRQPQAPARVSRARTEPSLPPRESEAEVS